ncbi:hypothetical protein LSAT2_007018 [Lamellibrachia satsuma]|nr:hypothetical protein LSAT2_007018 [Lamellibrachia satsuma]
MLFPLMVLNARRPTKRRVSTRAKEGGGVAPRVPKSTANGQPGRRGARATMCAASTTCRNERDVTFNVPRVVDRVVSKGMYVSALAATAKIASSFRRMQQNTFRHSAAKFGSTSLGSASESYHV